MEVFISLKGSDRPFADSFISENLKSKNKFKYWYLFDIQKDNTGEDSKETILDKIEKSSGALLLVSSEFLKSDFILNYELPAIFKKRKENSSYKIFPVFIENCDISKNKFLKDLEFYNSPGTNLQTLKNRSAKEYTDKIREINNFIDNNLSFVQIVLSLLKKPKILVSSLLFLSLFIFFNQFFNESVEGEDISTSEVNIVENFPDTTLKANSTFDSLNIGDCFNYEENFVAFAVTKDLLDKNSDIKSSNVLSLAIENGYIGENVEIVPCDNPHYFEVIFTSETKILNDDYIEIETPSDFLDFCIDQSFYYSGYKFRNIDAFIGAQYRESTKNYKFICASYKVDGELKVIQKSSTHKDIQQLSSETLYETGFDKLNVGDCFLHVNSWGIKDYQTTYNFGGYYEPVEVVNCSSNHTNELIYEIQLQPTEGGFLFPGVKLPIEVEELESYGYPRITKIQNERFNYIGGYVYEIITNNKYIAPINSIEDLTDVQYDLLNEEDIYISVAPYDSKYIHVIELDGSPNIVSKSRVLIFQEAENFCSTLPISGTDFYTDYATSAVYWEVIPIFSEDPQSHNGPIDLKCVLRLRNNDPLVIAGLKFKDGGNRTTKNVQGSLLKSFKNKYGDSLSNKRNIRIDYNLQGSNTEVKNLVELNIGDCFEVEGLFEYENYMSDTWNEDWLIKVSDCNVAHNHEVIISRPTLLSNDSRKELYEDCKDYVFVDLQFSKKLTLGNFEYSDIDYENSSFYFSSDNLSLKDLYVNKFFNKNLVDSKGDRKGSVCIHWYGDKNNDFVSEPPNETYYSAFEIFEPTSLNIENFYCPDEIKKDTYTEVVFRYTRGSSEIASVEYIEINGNLSVKADGLDDEYYGYDKDYLKTTLNKTFEGLVPQVIELVENTGEGVLTATITDELGNSDSAICTYKITN